jgi:hypothetical protein
VIGQSKVQKNTVSKLTTMNWPKLKNKTPASAPFADHSYFSLSLLNLFFVLYWSLFSFRIIVKNFHLETHPDVIKCQ